MSKDDKLTMARHTFDSRIKKVKEEARAEMLKEEERLKGNLIRLTKKMENQKKEMLEKIQQSFVFDCDNGCFGIIKALFDSPVSVGDVFLEEAKQKIDSPHIKPTLNGELHVENSADVDSPQRYGNEVAPTSRETSSGSSPDADTNINKIILQYNPDNINTIMLEHNPDNISQVTARKSHEDVSPDADSPQNRLSERNVTQVKGDSPADTNSQDSSLSGKNVVKRNQHPDINVQSYTKQSEQLNNRKGCGRRLEDNDYSLFCGDFSALCDECRGKT